MRIVHVITRFIRGGADENTLICCNGQVESGHEVTLIYGRQFDQEIVARLDSRVEAISVSSLVRPMRPGLDLHTLSKLKSILSTLHPDVVHTHTSKAGFLGRLAAYLAGVPIIVHGVHILPFHNVSRLNAGLYLAAEKLAATVTDAFVDVSFSMREEYLKLGLGKPETHVVIQSGMDIDHYRKSEPISGDELRELLPQVATSWNDAEIVLMVAALEERKRHLEFIPIFAEVARTRPRAVLVLAGTGPLKTAIEESVERHGLADRCVFIDFRDDISRWMRRAEVCVLSSMREGLPRVLVQYALAGRPIVATRLPGIDAAVLDGVNGFVTETVREMAEPINRILQDSQLRARLGERSSSLDLSAWDARRMIDQVEALYARLVAGKAAAVANESRRHSAN